MKVLRPFSDETGSQMVEFGLVLLPLMAVVFLIMDIAWVCFAQATLQHAVQVGVRAAISQSVPASFSGQDAYVKSVVQHTAMGFLKGESGLGEIWIKYYSPTNLSVAISGANSNAGGNIIQVSVANVPVPTLCPLLRTDWATVFMKATASDIMESPSPQTGLPTR